MRLLKRKATEANARAKDAKEAFEDMQRRCLERMEEEDTESTKAYGTTFTPVRKVYATIQDRAAFVEWAKDNDEELIEDKERKTELDRVVRTAIDDGQELPPGVGFYEKAFISQRAAS